MRRVKLVLAAAAVMVAMLVAFAGPAMADNDLNCRDARGVLIRCDGQLFAPVSRFDFDDFCFDFFFCGFPFGFDDGIFFGINQQIG